MMRRLAILSVLLLNLATFLDARATDGIFASDTDVNGAPGADAQAVETDVDAAIGISLTGFDVNNDPLTFAIDSNPSSGGLSGFDSLTGAVTYTPNSGFSGIDSFTFITADGRVQSDPEAVTIAVPEPRRWLQLAVGLAFLALVGRRR